MFYSCSRQARGVGYAQIWGAAMGAILLGRKDREDFEEGGWWSFTVFTSRHLARQGGPQ
jgi:hypothetical protein